MDNSPTHASCPLSHTPPSLAGSAPADGEAAGGGHLPPARGLGQCLRMSGGPPGEER